MSEIKSNIKKVNICMPKLNYKILSFNIKKYGKKIQIGEYDSIVMTVKKKDSDNDKYEFRKTLNNGISYNKEKRKL